MLLASDLLATSAIVPGTFPDAPGSSHGGPEVAIPLLHSNPTATKKIFLDFDGHVVSGTGWDQNYNGGNPIHAPAYSIDADIFNFTQSEINRIVRTCLHAFRAE